MPQASQAYNDGVSLGQQQAYVQQEYALQYSTPTYMAPAGRGAGYSGQGRGY
jgi:hypothetical protein